MSGLATLAAITLAVVLVTAALAKLRRPDRTAADFAELGLPAPRLLARAVPAVEIGVAVALVVRPGIGGPAAFALLTGFTVLLVGLVRRGAVVACACFGAVSDEPVSWVEVTRNVVLLVAAAVATTTTTPAAPDLAAAVAFSAAAVIGLVAIQLVAFKRDVGVVWSTELAGEAP